MAYSFKVVREFVDKHDNKKYEVGDQFPTDISKSVSMSCFINRMNLKNNILL